MPAALRNKTLHFCYTNFQLALPSNLNILNTRLFVLTIICCIITASATAQPISFGDTVAAYNYKRINTNIKGMQVLGAWGLANIAEGGIGYFSARQDEWKYFHEMNALWGVVNTGIAGFGLYGIKKDMAHKLTADWAYDRYRSNLRLYLVNAGLDVLYLGTGVGLSKYSETTKNNPALFSGFGKSIAIQGVFLLIFDNIVYAAHRRNNTRWIQLIDEIHLTNNGIMLNHNIK